MAANSGNVAYERGVTDFPIIGKTRSEPGRATWHTH
jgi:hypothetical protein